jgi:hypothetical protein
LINYIHGPTNKFKIPSAGIPNIGIPVLQTKFKAKDIEHNSSTELSYDEQ